MISPTIKEKILRVVNVFETGKPDGRYELLVVMSDGPGGKPQITYGRSQTTEYGNLHQLVAMYCSNGGSYGPTLRIYMDKVGREPLHQDNEFKRLLVDAGTHDPIMRTTQDTFFDKLYYLPALKFFDVNGFTLPLSLLVIYDSYIHSGRVPDFLRRRFGEKTPANGGSEKEWISRYTDVRHQWLKYHTNELLRKTIYRTRCFSEQTEAGNWDLTQVVRANGVDIA